MDMGNLIIVPSEVRGFKPGTFIVTHEYGTSHFILFATLQAAEDYVRSKA